MNAWLCGSFFTLIAIARMAAADEPALPVWNAAERKALEASGWVAGGLLLTDEPVEKLEPPAELKVEQPTAEEIAPEAVPSKEIAENFLPAYFAERPKTFLIDPQGLLSATEFRDRLNFLTYHAADSAIDLFVYVIAGNQEIPGEVREEETIERFFTSGRPAAIVYYYLGAPQRSTVYLSPVLTDSISATDQRRALASSVMEAFEKVNPTEQFEAFLVQMSIRVYWMERQLGGQSVAADVLSEPAAVGNTREASVKNRKMEKLQQLGKRFGWIIGALIGLLAAGWLTHWFLNRRGRYLFPQFEVEPRLGGSHGAGIGAVILFSSAALPPASQRDQVPDYLRRK